MSAGGGNQLEARVGDAATVSMMPDQRPRLSARRAPHAEAPPLILAIGLSFVVAACAESTAASPDSAVATREPLCDGSSAIRFVYRAESLFFVDTAFAFENGASFLIIAGTCDYWSYNPITTDFGTWVLADVHTGHLSNEQAESIAGRLQYDSLRALAGDHRVELDASIYDLYVSDGSNVVLCNYRCRHASSAALRDLYASADDVLDELHRAAPPVTGHLWYSIEEPVARPWRDGAAEWPLSTPLALGGGRMNAADAAIMRALRVRQRASEFSYGSGFVPCRIGDGPVFAVFLRDGVPFEDGEGQVPIPRLDGGL